LRAKTIPIALTFLFVSAAVGQSLDRVLHFTQADTPQGWQEIATAIRGTTDIQLSVDSASRTMALSGTAGQVAVAEWLFHKLDQPADRPPDGTHEYAVPDGGNDVVRVFFLAHPRTPQGLLEIGTATRGIADIGRVFFYTASSAIVLRATAGDIALAGWLVEQLDKPDAEPPPGQHEYVIPGSKENVVRVFYPAHTRTAQSLQEMVTTIRSVADINRLFVSTGPESVTVRGTADRVALAEWLFHELDQPAGGPLRATHEYAVPRGGSDIVRVYFLAHTGTPQGLQEMLSQIRSTTEIQRVFICSAPKAVAIRGTAAQLAQAERLIEDRDQPAAR
jgi:hypothetical protein